jgi:hypothetical protein
MLAKIMERMVMARLNWYLETQLLTLEQAGFRPKLSTSHQLIKFTHLNSIIHQSLLSDF